MQAQNNSKRVCFDRIVNLEMGKTPHGVQTLSIHDAPNMNEGFRSAAEEKAAWIRAWIIPPQRILVVDDDSNYRQLSIDVLVESGYAVDTAEDGAAGWEALQLRTYDLVITDNAMPKMTGLEMIEKLRLTGVKVPVLMATGCLPLVDFANKPWLYPEATLQRPFSNAEFVATVKRVLS